MLVCSWSAGLAACLASGSDTLVPCSRMTPLSKACLIYLAYCLSRVPPCTNAFKCFNHYYRSQQKQKCTKKTTSVCLHSNPHPVRSVDMLKNILSEAASVLYVGLPLRHACDCTSFLHLGTYKVRFGKVLGLQKHWNYSHSQTAG